ncbi:MAG TPA: UDP-N-acetylmuramate--L-alanine ligase [Firmicutes bacterium]|nr:UDP-N-acetylmuramate--L-alanine ligase [Bacillota bacterium]
MANKIDTGAGRYQKGRMLLKSGDRIYFIGIGGNRLSALAKIYSDRGYRIAGSDRCRTKATRELEARGIPVDYGHDPRCITKDLDLVVYTNAVGENNPQLIKARAEKIPVLEGAELLGRLMREMGVGIAVAGTHGKTTTTAMISLILTRSGKDPTVEVGGEMKELPGNHRTGASPYIVVEACEFRRSFLHLSPKYAVITNVDWDHPDIFPDSRMVVDAFQEFIRLLPADGGLIFWREERHFPELAAVSKAPVTSFGFSQEADWFLLHPKVRPPLGTEAELFYRGEYKGRLRLQVPGEYNLLNALAALATGVQVGVEVEEALAILEEFQGVKRRFEIKGEVGKILVVDDYAHHPVAIAKALRAARSHFPGRIWCVFQPHLFSRTRCLLTEFAHAFNAADILVLADIYPAREKDPGDISSRILAAEAGKHHGDVRYLGDMASIKEHLLQETLPGDLIITMGAGDIWKVGEEYLQEKEGFFVGTGTENLQQQRG